MVSGLVEYVTEDELNGRLVVLICNMKPVNMRGKQLFVVETNDMVNTDLTWADFASYYQANSPPPSQSSPPNKGSIAYTLIRVLS